MNLNLLISLFKGSNIWATMAKVLAFAAGMISAIDKDNKGNDDLIAGVALSASEGLAAYGRADYNRLGKIIDSIIEGLQTLKAELIASGKILVVNKRE